MTHAMEQKTPNWKDRYPKLARVAAVLFGNSTSAGLSTFFRRSEPIRDPIRVTSWGYEKSDPKERPERREFERFL